MPGIVLLHASCSFGKKKLISWILASDSAAQIMADLARRFCLATPTLRARHNDYIMRFSLHSSKTFLTQHQTMVPPWLILDQSQLFALADSQHSNPIR